MHRRIALAVVTVVGVSSGLATGCDEPTTEGATTDPGSAAGVTERRGSGGGFSADLAKQIGQPGGTEPGSAAAGAASIAGSAGSGAVGVGSAGSGSAGSGSAGSGSAGSGNAGSGSAGSGSAGAAGSVRAGSGSATVAVAGSGAVSATASAAGSGTGSATAAVAAGSASAAKQGSADVVVSMGSGAGSGSASKPGSAVGVGAAGSAPPPPNPNAARVPVKPSPELAAIKLSLSPNWDRDVGEAGTISLAVKIPGRTDSKVFAWRYGYEDPKAPADRDAYKKWLAANKLLTASLDRQRGAAWYLEGVDGSGAPAFRIIVSFGGRKLICGGLLYRDAASNQLGDLRDKTIIQAKEICETVAL